MSYLVLKEAYKHNNIIFFKRKNDEGLELWYSGTITELDETTFHFKSIYDNNYTFDMSEIIELKGPKVEADLNLGEFGSIRKPLKYIIFDTETTGLPKNYKADVTDTDNWPRIIQFAWSVHDDEGKEIEHRDILVKPDGFEIPEETTKIHGISQEMAMEKGIPIEDAMKIFTDTLNSVDVLVAHNISFDEMVIGCEYYRLNQKDPMPEKQKICTKEASVDYCKIPGRGGRYSWASLDDLYKILFNQTFTNQHNASSDVRACALCFFELKRLGVI